MIDKRRSAFTLAEVLITLAIIGVIAAISVPSLIQKTNQAELITAWKKTFATLSQATSQYAFEAGTIPKYTNAYQYSNAYANYLKIIKSCEYPNIAGNCWHKKSEYFNFDGTPNSYDYNEVRNATDILSSGVLLNFYTESSGTQYTCVSSPTYNQLHGVGTCVQLEVDVNGFKGPNTIGKDIYGAYLYSDGMLMPFSPDTEPNGGWANSANNLYSK